MSTVIAIDQLEKRYGKRPALQDLSLTVQQGEIFGYLGPNGAGKTTTIRLLLGLISPSGGRAEVLGHDVRDGDTSVRRRIGYLPGELAMYEKLTGTELLRYFASLRGVDWRRGLRYADRLRLDLTRPIRTLSRGNKQKVGLVQALMHEPELLLLDEPTSGLDPLVQQEFNQIMREFRAEGRTVFLSSHVLAEVETLADRVAIIREGRLVSVDQVDQLKARAVRRLKLEFAAPIPESLFQHLENVHDVQVRENVLACAVTGSVDALIKMAARFEVLAITSHTADLEEIFLGFYQGEPSHVA